MAEIKKTAKKSAKPSTDVVAEAVVSQEETLTEKPKAPRRRVVKAAVEAEATVAAVVPSEDMAIIRPSGTYVFGLGRRKTSIARVRVLVDGKGQATVNGKPADEYFQTFEQRECLKAPLRIIGQENALDLQVSVEGGGMNGQAEAVRLGMVRALVLLNPAFRKTFKKLGFMSRDPRAKERKKPGLRRARRAPQWSKR